MLSGLGGTSGPLLTAEGTMGLGARLTWLWSVVVEDVMFSLDTEFGGCMALVVVFG